MSPDEIWTTQCTELSTFLAHARKTVPHYSKAIQNALPIDANSLRDGAWRDVPILSRQMVNDLGAQLQSTDIPAAHGALDPIYTSGTTGRPVRVVRTAHALNYWRAFTSRDHIWHDRDITGTLAVIRSSKKGDAVYPKGAFHSVWGSKDGVFQTGSCVSLNVNTAIPDMVEWLQRSEPRHLVTLPNILIRMAQYCVDHGIRLPTLRDIQTHGENCGGFVRDLVGEAWGVAVHDVYSTREVGYMALQCPENGAYHVQSEGVYLEVLDAEGHPCPPGEPGRVVVTTFQNHAMPLIRYEVGDLAVMGAPCACGRGLPVIQRIAGRQQDVLVLPTGEQRATLLGSPDIRAFMALAPIEQYQFAHTAAEKLEVRLVVKRDLTETEETGITEWLRKKYGYPFEINFVYLDEIARTAAGKYKDFVREF